MADEKNNRLLKIFLAVATTFIILALVYYIFKPATPVTEDVYIGEQLGVPPYFLGCSSGIVATVYKKNGKWVQDNSRPFNTTPPFYVLDGGDSTKIYGITPGTTTFATYPTTNGTIMPCLLNTAFAWGILNRTPWTMQVTLPFNNYQSGKAANQVIQIDPFSYTYMNDSNLGRMPAGIKFMPMFMYQKITYKFFNKDKKVISCGPSDENGECAISCPGYCGKFNPILDYFVLQFNAMPDKANPIKLTQFTCRNVVNVVDIPAYSGASIPTPLELATFYNQNGGFLNTNNKIDSKTYVINGQKVSGYVAKSGTLQPAIVAAVPWVLNYNLSTTAVNPTSPPVITIEAFYTDTQGNEISIVIGVVTTICPSPCLYETFDSTGNVFGDEGHGGVYTYKYSCLSCPSGPGCSDPSANSDIPYNFFPGSDTCAKNMGQCSADFAGNTMTGSSINWLQSHLSGASYLYSQMLISDDATFSAWKGGVGNPTLSGSVQLPADTPVPLYVGQKFNIGYSYLDNNGNFKKELASSTGFYVPLNTYTYNGILEIDVQVDASSTPITITPPTITNKLILGKGGLPLPINLKLLEKQISYIKNKIYFSAINPNSNYIIPDWITKGNNIDCPTCVTGGGGGPCSMPFAVSGAPTDPKNGGSVCGQSGKFVQEWAIFATDQKNNSNMIWYCDDLRGYYSKYAMQLAFCSTYRANTYMNMINGKCWQARIPFLLYPAGGAFAPIIKYDLTINWDTLSWIFGINSEAAMKDILDKLRNDGILQITANLDYIPYNVSVLGAPEFGVLNDNGTSGSDYFTRCSTKGGNNTGYCGTKTRFEFIQGWVFKVQANVYSKGSSNFCTSGVLYTSESGTTCGATGLPNPNATKCGTITLPPNIPVPKSTGCKT